MSCYDEISMGTPYASFSMGTPSRFPHSFHEDI